MQITVLDIVHITARFGYAAAFTGIFLESMGVPFPGETMLIATAVLSATGKLDIRLIAFLGCVGAFAGSSVSYAIGFWGGRPLIDRLMSLMHADPKGFSKAEASFIKYGVLAVFAARFIVILRSYIGLVAGALKMPYPRFALFTALGSIAWSGTYSALGYVLGRNLHLLFAVVRNIEISIALALIFALLAIAGLYLRRRHHKSS